MKALKKYYFHYVFKQPINSSAIQTTNKYLNINISSTHYFST